MYKSLLCWRYLKTRYLAMACIVSVMLGVATLIVVNSVMSGFSTMLRERLHGILSDVVIDSHSLEGFADPEGKMAAIRNDPVLGPRVAAMTPTLEVFAMFQFRYPNGEMHTRPVRLLGIDMKSRGAIGGFNEHLVRQSGSAEPSFAVPQQIERFWKAREKRMIEFMAQNTEMPFNPEAPPDPAPPPRQVKVPCGVVVGNLIANYRDHEGVERPFLLEGDSVWLTTISGAKMAPVQDHFLIVDLYKSGMAEYDGNYVFVPLDYLQHLRSMHDRVTAIQIKLNDYADAKVVVDRLRKLFDTTDPRTAAMPMLRIATWEDKQGPLLEAIRIEKGILNVLLFLIIAVAGFGILAIFSMIVAEKTRDIGVLKALGASSRGVMNIFLGYGLLLGIVGAGFGTLLGLSITVNLNEIADKLAEWTGEKLFNPTVYYFDKIPTDIQPTAVLLVNLGAVLIAVLFSILPAMRAAWLHPVRALRYE
jgi:lipoprotein-releasing system permease protein